jgi:bifunctional DNase/RNase
MIELIAQDVIVRIQKEVRWPSPGAQRRVLLRERDGQRLLHLWAWADDGDGVALELAGQKPARPLIYDVTTRLLTQGQLAVQRAVITDPDSLATLWVRDANGAERPLDVTPTDAVNLALRAGAPILTDEAILSEYGIPADELWATLEAEETEFADHLRDHLPPGTEVMFPQPGALEWRSIVPPEWRLFTPGE